MKLLFDLLSAQPASNNSKFHGGGEYIKTVFERLIRRKNIGDIILVFYDFDKFIDEWVLDLLKENNIRAFDIKNIKDITAIFDIEHIDLFYSGLAYCNPNEFVPQNVRTIGTIHGLRAVELPVDNYQHYFCKGIDSIKSRVLYFRKKTVKKNALQNYADALLGFDEIVCVSNHTKYAIQSYYPALKDKPINVYYTPAKHYDGKVVGHQRVEGKYILMLGLNRCEKNGVRAIKAIESLFSDGYLSDYRVVTIGQMPIRIKKLIKDLTRYQMYDYVSTEQLEQLYSECDIFFYPSLNEGFGMPPLEAMKYGKTCVVSNVCSLPEICGEAVYYTNPYDIFEMRNRLIRAAKEKIDHKIVCNHIKVIQDKQENDLDTLCRHILGLQ